MGDLQHQYETRPRVVSFKQEDFSFFSSLEASSEDSFLTSSPDQSPPNSSHVAKKAVPAPNKITTKRPPLQRKEIQRRYRERQKLKTELANGTACQVDDEMAILAEENRKLEEERVALLIGLHQANLITNFMRSCRLSNTAANASASAAAGEIHFPFSPNKPNEVADALFNNSLHGYEPSEYLVRQYAALPPSILVERDRHHFNLILDTLMAEWYSTYSTRDEVVMKLQGLFNTRRRISIVIAQDSPNKHKEIMSTAIQPPPGSALGDLATKTLQRVSSEINLDGQQLQSIKEAWLEYLFAIEALNFDVSMAQMSILGMNQPNSATARITGGGGEAVPTTTAPQQQQAGDFLNLSDSVATLFLSSRRMSIAYTRLAGAVLSSLDVIQLAKLFRGCRPYFPDHVQLCKMFLDVDVE